MDELHATMTPQEHHVGFAFEVTVGDVPDALVEAKATEWGGSPTDSWYHHLQAVVRALRADTARLDAYIAHRCAWGMMLEEEAEGDRLCATLEVPSDSEEVITLLLGLHLPPATRRFVKSLREPWRDGEGREHDACFDFAETLAEVIVVAPAGVWHHRAA